MMTRVHSSVMLWGYPAVAFVLFLIGAGLGIALVLQSMLRDRKTKPPMQHGPN